MNALPNDEAKTCAALAAIIADAARATPHTLRPIQVAAEQVAELAMLCGFDDDLANQVSATSNRIRGLLAQIHPLPHPGPATRRGQPVGGRPPEEPGAAHETSERIDRRRPRGASAGPPVYEQRTN